MQNPPGGIGRYTAELARLLDASGSVTDGDTAETAAPIANIENIASTEKVELVPFVARHARADVDARLSSFGLDGLEPVMLPLPRAALYEAWNTFGVGSLGRLARELRVLDLVHAPSVAVPPKSRAALVVSVHDAAPLLFPQAFTRQGRRFHRHGYEAASRRADLVITPSATAADEVAGLTGIARERIRIVPHGVIVCRVSDDEVAQTRARLGLTDERFVLWVGTLEPRKNVTMLVEGFRIAMQRAHLPHVLVLAGADGWMHTPAKLRAAADNLGDKVRIVGSLADRDLFALYRAAELFAFPSVHEGFGMPVLEAMAAHTAVLCSDIPVLHEIAGPNAHYADPHDAESWADALVSLLTDDAHRRELVDGGAAHAARYTWPACAARTLAVYREAVARV